MKIRELTLAGLLVLLFPSVTFAFAPGQGRDAQPLSSPAAEPQSPSQITHIAFAGLRRISPEAVRAQISIHAGQPLDFSQIEKDVRTLARLGWFDSIRIETHREGNSQVCVTFFLDELPFLSEAEFAGSRLLSKEQIASILSKAGISLRPAAPADPVTLHRASRAIEGALAELSHPQARADIQREALPSAAVRVRFLISDGPRIPVANVRFEGHLEIEEGTLRRQMKRIAPDHRLASLRGKDIYTAERIEEDRACLLAYYQNYGYPEARIGAPEISTETAKVRHWRPWPHRAAETRLRIAIPVEAGTLYRLGSVTPAEDLVAAAATGGRQAIRVRGAQPGQLYSAQAAEQLRRAWLARVRAKSDRKPGSMSHDVLLVQTPDRERGQIHVQLRLSPSPPYVVRQIEFQGARRFSDRFYRRRVLIEEGKPLDERAFEAGLTRLTRTGYIRPIKKDDIQIRTDDAAHTAEVSIRIEEIGRQRVSFSGGQSSFGSTLAIVYSVFDLLHCDELLAAQFEGGPESLRLLLGLTMDGFLSSRGSLAFSIFNDVLRPRLGGTVKGPFFTSRTSGLDAGWSYSLSNSDSIGVHYELSQTSTRYSLALPPELTGLPLNEIRSNTSSRSLGVNWTRDTGRENILLSSGVAGGWLGGGENLLRSSAVYARIFPDPFLQRGNAWAFRGTFSGAGSFRGDLPFASRLFTSDAFVRGFRPGEIGPYSPVRTRNPDGTDFAYASPAGATLLGAGNAEYRVPLADHFEAAGFTDLGSGWLLPNWLGHSRPDLLHATNGVLRGSAGLELRWTVPGVQVPIRSYYAFNILRLDRAFRLPGGKSIQVSNRRSAFGWALGNLF